MNGNQPFIEHTQQCECILIVVNVCQCYYVKIALDIGTKLLIFLFFRIQSKIAIFDLDL